MITFCSLFHRYNINGCEFHFPKGLTVHLKLTSQGLTVKLCCHKIYTDDSAWCSCVRDHRNDIHHISLDFYFLFSFLVNLSHSLSLSLLFKTHLLWHSPFSTLQMVFITLYFVNPTVWFYVSLKNIQYVLKMHTLVNIFTLWYCFPLLRRTLASSV